MKLHCDCVSANGACHISNKDWHLALDVLIGYVCRDWFLSDDGSECTVVVH